MSFTAVIDDPAARPSLARLSSVEARKMVDTRAGLWLLFLTVLLAIGGTLGQSLGAAESQAKAVDVFYTAVAGVGVLLPIVGILLVTSEWSQRSGLITFALVPARLRIVAAKFTAVLLVGLLAGLICLLLGLLGGSVLGSGSDISSADVGKGLLYMAISVSIGTGLGLVFMSSPLAIVFLFAGPILVGAVGAVSSSFDDVTVWLDQSALTDLIATDASTTVEWEKIAVTALAWVALPLALGILRLRRGDID